MSPIALEFFGAPRVQRDAVPVHIARRKAVALLAYLAITQQAHERDVLAALFWPELSQRRARANLRHAVYTLNTALAPIRLQSDEGQVALLAQPDLRVDVLRFRRLQAATDAHRHAYPHLCEACIQSLSNAANLYRGDFLAGFSLAGAPEFEAWQLLQREALQGELASILDRLAHVYAEAGRRQYDLAIAYARRRLALDPLHEPAHRTLMHLYAESGDRAAALRQYAECAQLLDVELGVQPEPETDALMAHIRDGHIEDSLSSPAGQSGASLPAPPSTFHSLPAQATTFIGRARELNQIARRLADPDCRLLTIVGPGGSGKTRLAIQAAAAQAHCYRDGVRFVDLAPVESPALLATAIERSLEMPELGSSDQRQRLQEFLRPKQMLLLLDNLEHLLDGVDLLPDLLHAAPDLMLLVTSRERLNVREEWLSPLEGLSYQPGPVPGMPPVQSDAPVDLSGFDASLLFLNRMRKLRPNTVPDSVDAFGEQDAQAIAAICRLLEGMPLAIELAAGWTRTLTLQELQHEIEKSLTVLSGTLRDVPPRLRSMHAAFDHSWGLLSPKERNVMRQFSVFRGGCTRHAAGAIAGATVEELAGLVDKSWLRLREGGRYAIHELARQYCEEKLNAVDPTDEALSTAAVRKRHCAYYRAYLDTFFRNCNYEPKTLDDLLLEFGNLLAALQTAVAIHDLHTALVISWSVFFVGDMMGWLRFSIDTLNTIRPALEEQLADPATVEPEWTDIAHVICGILHAQYSQYGQVGAFDEADACSAQIVELAQEMRPGRARAYWQALGLYDRATIAHKQGDHAAGYRLAQKTRVLVESDEFECFLYGKERGHSFWGSEVYSYQAEMAFALGDYDASERNFATSEAIRQASGEERFLGMNLGHHAQLAEIVGDLERAERYAAEGLRFSEKYGDRIGIGMGHRALGRALAAQGRHDAARRHLLTSLETGRRTGRIDIVTYPLCELGRIDLAEGNPEAARHRFEDALAALARAGADHHNTLAAVWLGLGWCALAEEDLPEAQRLFAKAEAQRGACAFELEEARAGQAHVLLRQGDDDAARAMLQKVADNPVTAYNTRAQAQATLESLLQPAAE